MKGLSEWVKSHGWAALVLAFLLYFFVLRPLVSIFFGSSLFHLSMPAERSSRVGYETPLPGVSSNLGSSLDVNFPLLPVPLDESAPVESTNRIVVTETTLSMVVENVNIAVADIEHKAATAGGYMVGRHVSQPEEAPSATLVVRVPSSRIDEFLQQTKDVSVKVTMENVVGTDVTDAYEDLQAKIAIYQANMNKFSALMTQTDDIEYLIRIQKELINLQNQIDQLRGRQQLLEQTAKLAKVTFYLSSDEWSLPYAPATSFRPKVIFKEAVRALIQTLRGLAEKAIWLAVYSVVWGPVLIVILFIRRRKSKSALPQSKRASSPQV